MSRKLIFSLIGIAVLAFILSNMLFTVRITQQALVLQFGDPVSVKQEAGLHYKLPFIQNVVFYEKRILDLDPPVIEVLLADKKRINVDGFARYKITNPLQFYSRLRNEDILRDRLGKILNSAIRRNIAEASLTELLSQKRNIVMGRIKGDMISAASTFGIEVVDIRIGRTDLPEQTSQAVYSRMQAEREREARELRAEGEEEALKIRAEADRIHTVILADARRQSDILSGEGEALRNNILADAFERDAEFFRFNKTLEQYKNNLLNGDTTMVLSPNSEFFRYLKSQ